MVYDAVLVDVFNLYYRRARYALDNSAIALSNSMIDYIEREVKKHQAKDKPFYLLFDPIAKNDLGLDNSFRFSTERKDIMANYKANRKKNPGLLQVVDTIRKYYSHRGNEVVEVISSKYEADDYVETIIKDLGPSAKVAMVTTDLDWARFLSDNVSMINEGFDKPFTSKAFIDKYNFIPTVASVSMFKALFGDASDNIQGALMTKKLKNARAVKLKAFEFVQELGNNKSLLDDVEERLKKYVFAELIEKENKSKEEAFVLELLSTDPKFSLQSTVDLNLQVIKTRCKDYKKYAATKDIDETFNNLIAKSLGHAVKGEKKKFRFGNIKS